MEKSLKLKGNGGITLIALVITIIVLIILAGISIAMISGQDGIISKAGQGAAANQLGAAKDKCALIAAEAVNDVYNQVYVNHTLTADEINTTIDSNICTKIDGNTEILNLLGGSGNGSTEVTASANEIKLTYSDGTYVNGNLENGVITWGSITTPSGN